MSIVEVTPATIRFAAMNLLAMREHSAKELYQKLNAKFSQENWVQEVIARLKDEGLQSDERFAQAFINMRKGQGKGQLIINMELKERGVSAEMISELGIAEQDEWNQLALKARQKKYGTAFPQDIKEKTKQMRFLSGRGFNSISIQYALKQSCED